MKAPRLIFFYMICCSLFQVAAQEQITKSEKSFAKIKTKPGTRDAIWVSDYGKPYTMRVTFPEASEDKTALIVALHWAGGGNTYKEFNDCLILPALAGLQAIIVSPEGENQLWSTANNVEKLLSLIAYSRKYWNIDPAKIAVTGYSNGGNGSWYFAEYHPELFSAGIPMASAYPISEKIDIPLYIIHGAKDELFAMEKTRMWIERTRKAGTELVFVPNDSLSHFQGCAYVDDLIQAGKWLQRLWEPD